MERERGVVREGEKEEKRESPHLPLKRVLHSISNTTRKEVIEPGGSSMKRDMQISNVE